MTQPTMNRRTFVKGGLAASAMAALAACGKKGWRHQRRFRLRRRGWHRMQHCP